MKTLTNPAAAHTPGPWFRMDRRYKDSDSLAVEIATFSDEGHPTALIARVNHNVINPTQEVSDETEANARLIASAPDLLAALEAASVNIALSFARAESDLRMWPVKDLDSVEFQSLQTYTNKTFEALKQARAAIARAKGVQS
jgi:hypothetical protein